MSISLYRFVRIDGDAPAGAMWAMCRLHASKQKVPDWLRLERVPSMGARYVCHDCRQPSAKSSAQAHKRFMAKILRLA